MTEPTPHISKLSNSPPPSAPSQAEPEILEHEYDGIKEYDNPMPNWWVWIFWGTFYFSVGYYIHYQLTGNGTSVAQAYEADVSAAREAEASKALGSEINEESLGRLMADKAMLADAGRLFTQKCTQCHGERAEGLIGPNLTDAYWLHGRGDLMSIYQVITQGVQSKGMPPWGRQLRPIEIGKLTAFVGSLRNTKLPGPKGPEGTLVDPAVATP